MIDEKKTQEKAVETMTVWADANQRVLSQMVEFSTAAAKESVRLYGELQQSAIEALRERLRALEERLEKRRAQAK